MDDIIIQLKIKQKRIKQELSKWSKEKFGDFFNQLAIRDEIVRMKEKFFFEECPKSRVVLQQTQVELKFYLHYEEEYWRQKVSMY